MHGIVNLIKTRVGAVSTAVTAQLPTRAEAIETGAGFLLIGGLGLLGFAFPIVL